MGHKEPGPGGHMSCGPTDVKHPEETAPREGRQLSGCQVGGEDRGGVGSVSVSAHCVTNTTDRGNLGTGNRGALIAPPETGSQDRGSIKCSSWDGSSSCRQRAPSLGLHAACPLWAHGESSVSLPLPVRTPVLSDQNPTPRDSLNLSYLREGPSPAALTLGGVLI